MWITSIFKVEGAKTNTLPKPQHLDTLHKEHVDFENVHHVNINPQRFWVTTQFSCRWRILESNKVLSLNCATFKLVINVDSKLSARPLNFTNYPSSMQGVILVTPLCFSIHAKMISFNHEQIDYNQWMTWLGGCLNIIVDHYHVSSYPIMSSMSVAHASA